MPPPTASFSNTVTRRLQIIFGFSIALLLGSLVLSFVSIQKLITNSQLVNHTNEVLFESEKIISAAKDGETGQRGYLVTRDPIFLEPYYRALDQTMAACKRVQDATEPGSRQRASIDSTAMLVKRRFAKMQHVLELVRDNRVQSQEELHKEMVAGKMLMDDLRWTIDNFKAEETRLLNQRLAEQSRYINRTPILSLLAAILSIGLAFLAYFRIKADLDRRVAEQQAETQRYLETERRIAVLEDLTGEVAAGNYAVRSADTEADDDLGRIGRAFNTMTGALEVSFSDLRRRDWLQVGSAKLNEALRGESSVNVLADKLAAVLADYLRAAVATVYVAEQHGTYRLAGHYAAAGAPPAIVAGEGLAGQAIRTRRITVIDAVPAGYLRVASSLGESQPARLAFVPVVHDGACVALIELAFLQPLEPLQVQFLEVNAESIGKSIDAGLNYQRLQELLEETQAQSEELQAQQTELEQLNAHLETQTERLQGSEEELRRQQQELVEVNRELEARTELLEEKNDEIQRKAAELARTTRYKSEFLANMSHELRTPLNSILLLSRLLGENREGNLSADQLEYARVIGHSGTGLLGLIDEILDLSKIEAGKMQLEVAPASVSEIVDDLRALFSVQAAAKNIELRIDVTDEAPVQLHTDRLRLEQILKNLLSNALKFTEKGAVSLHVKADGPEAVAFVVADTGVGIPAEKQQFIFEAFHQADGSTKRRYGGTGLGLSISRELARLLGGRIGLQSEVGHGSVFTLTLPVSGPAADAAEPGTTSPVESAAAPTSATPEGIRLASGGFISDQIPAPVEDDRASIVAGDRCILIVEDDVDFARGLLEYTRRQGYKGVVVVRGDEALPAARQYRPAGILLDLQLPVKSGFTVLDELKHDPLTRHVPVHVMSSHEIKNKTLQQHGAIDFTSKPLAYEQIGDIFRKIEYVLSHNPKKVLIVEENTKHARALAQFLERYEISSDVRHNVEESLDALQTNAADCIILDMGMPDATAYALLEQARKQPGLEDLPIIVFTGKSLSLHEEQRIRQYADSIVVKTAHSYNRILDEVSLFLHLMEKEPAAAPAPGQRRPVARPDDVLHDKTVLVADDDVRNIFSLSKVLESKQINVVTALDGEEALRRLAENPAIDAVLLDMMMPNLDGYDTARRIRQNPAWKKLPVIALTAKAMTGDRDKCIEAGASDYITKPVDVDQLFSLLRVWMYE